VQYLGFKGLFFSDDFLNYTSPKDFTIPALSRPPLLQFSPDDRGITAFLKLGFPFLGFRYTRTTEGRVKLKSQEVNFFVFNCETNHDDVAEVAI
jgi:hypothetical protein